MVNLNDPQSWVSLHWKQGILIQYFGSKAGKKELSFNVIKPSNQCMDMISDIREDTICRITGLKIKGNDTKCCDNILPLSDVAILCGLPGRIYIQESKKLLEELKATSNKKEYYDKVTNEYEQYQRELWSMVYAWSHKECHELKREFPFLELDFKNGISVGDIIYENIAKLLYELILSKQPKLPKSSKRSKRKTTKKQSMISSWRKRVLSRYRMLNENGYILDQVQSILSEIQRIQKFLTQYNDKQLQVNSYISLCATLRVVINQAFDLTPVTWTQPVVRVLSDKGMMSNETIYYTDENLTNESIYKCLLELQGKQPELFETRLLEDNNDEMITSLSDFYVYLRSYLNMTNAVVNSLEEQGGDEEAYTYFKQSVVDIIDYIWNEWSSKTQIKEAKIKGESSDLDRLSKGAQLDSAALKYSDELFYIHLLSFIGDKLTDKYQEITSVNDVIESTDTIKTDETDETEETQKIVESDELRSMEFKLGDNSFYSNLIRG